MPTLPELSLKEGGQHGPEVLRHEVSISTDVRVPVSNLIGEWRTEDG